MIEAVSSEAGKAVTLSMSRFVGLAVSVELIGGVDQYVGHVLAGLVSSRWEVLTACRLPGYCRAGAAVVRWLSSLHWVEVRMRVFEVFDCGGGAGGDCDDP